MDVTEADWKSCVEVEEMCEGLDYLAGRARTPISSRKWLLFILACIRRAWHVFADERSRRLMEEVEPYADGFITRKELWERADRWNDPPNPDLCSMDHPDTCPPRKRPVACLLHAWTFTQNLPMTDFEAYNAAGWVRKALGNRRREERAQVAILRDIFGNPFVPMPVLAASVLAWDAGCVRRLAQAIYNEAAFDRLPILADALEEAGCTNKELLAHLRGPGPHVRGCWALDTLLGLTQRRPTERDASWS